MAVTKVVDSCPKLEDILRIYEESTQSHFILKYSDKNFFDDVLTSSVLNSRQRIRWSLSALTDQGIVLPFTGVPFIFLGNRTLSCHHGPDLNKTSKIKQRDCRVAKSVDSQAALPKQRYLVQPTKKMDCPVVIHMKKLVFFPQYKIDADTEYLRRCTGKLLKDALISFESSAHGTSNLQMELLYYVRLPDPNTHVNHVIQETPGIREPLRGSVRTTRIAEEIKEEECLIASNELETSVIQPLNADNMIESSVVYNMKDIQHTSSDGQMDILANAMHQLQPQPHVVGHSGTVSMNSDASVVSIDQSSVNTFPITSTVGVAQSPVQSGRLAMTVQASPGVSQHIVLPVGQRHQVVVPASQSSPVHAASSSVNRQTVYRYMSPPQPQQTVNRYQLCALIQAADTATQSSTAAMTPADNPPLISAGDQMTAQYFTTSSGVFTPDSSGIGYMASSQMAKQQPSWLVGHGRDIVESTIDRLAARYSKVDQEKLLDVVREMDRADDGIVLMQTGVRHRSDIVLSPQNLAALNAADDSTEDFECKIDVPNADLMFIYQSTEMRRLYRRYGGLMVVLDALYRADRYPLPMFFLLVRTNVNYQVAAVMVVQRETRQTLVNALHIIRGWNPKVNPRYALVDFSQEEVAALEDTFPGIHVHICDYHREQSWQRWMSKNGLGSEGDGVRTKLRRIANALNVEDVSRTLTEFESSAAFMSNRRLAHWFSSTWKPHLMRWSAAYRSAELTFLLYTNNGTKNMNEDFLHEFMTSCSESTLSDLLGVIIRRQLPALLGTYMELNVRSSSLYRKYNDDVPQYLRNRPRRLIDDMRKKMVSLDSGAITGVQVKSDVAGVFLVSSRGGRPPHEVVFGDESTFCSCTCQSFQRTQLLCTHFCAVFRALPNDWTFEHITPLYTQSPLLTLDEDILQSGLQASFSQQNSVSPPDDELPILSSPVAGPKLLKSERQKARSLLRKVYEMASSVSDVELLRNIVTCLEPIQKEMSELVSKDSAQAETADSSGRKRKVEVAEKCWTLQKKQIYSDDGRQMRVVEIHVIDGSAMGNVTASGPTFTVSQTPPATTAM